MVSLDDDPTIIDWINGTEYGQALTTGEQTKHVLPLVLNYLTPQVVLVIITLIAYN